MLHFASEYVQSYTWKWLGLVPFSTGGFIPSWHLATSGDIAGHHNWAGRCCLLRSSEQRLVANHSTMFRSVLQLRISSPDPYCGLKNPPRPGAPFSDRYAEFVSVEFVFCSYLLRDWPCVSLVSKAVTAKPVWQWTLPYTFVLFGTLFLEDEDEKIEQIEGLLHKPDHPRSIPATHSQKLSFALHMHSCTHVIHIYNNNNNKNSNKMIFTSWIPHLVPRIKRTRNSCFESSQ